VDDVPADETAAEEPTEDTKADKEEAEQAQPEQAPSVSQQSKQRSQSFRQGVSPSAEVQELYKKQAARIEELERENKAFKEQQEEGAARLAKAEEELESLREGSSDLAELRGKAKEADRLSTELASVQRQLSQAQQAAKGTNRRVSGASTELTEQLASKTSTIESLELELSNLRHQLNGLQNTLSEKDASAKDLEDKVKAAETETASYKQELDQLKVSLAFPDESTTKEDPSALTNRITVLESDLRTATSNLTAAQNRATSLEQKIEALTKLHRDTTAANATKDKELTDLRNQLKRRDRPSHVRDASEFELGDEETETGALQARIRALEAENFELRRGVWREKRAELQPGMDDDGHHPEYENVDLSTPYSAHPGRNSSIGRQGQQHSTFQDVLTSGISAFTGRPRDEIRRGSSNAAGTLQQAARQRAESLGLLSDDSGAFDEEAWRLAQEEEAKRRVERVREVKKGLEGWRGWRVDLVEVRQNGGLLAGRADVGEVFEV
jgi:predicted  nucleic acid-binding Zn-ribbon protein